MVWIRQEIGERSARDQGGDRLGLEISGEEKETRESRECAGKKREKGEVESNPNTPKEMKSFV